MKFSNAVRNFAFLKKKTSKRKHDEHEEQGQEGCSSSSIPEGTLDDSRVNGNSSSEVNTGSSFRPDEYGEYH